MYRVMLVEDEVRILNYMETIVNKFDEFEIIGTYDIPENALTDFGKFLPDVVFLDVEMPRINGIEVARQMMKIKQDVKVIFTTAYAHYAVNAFEVEAIDYLMKPITSEDILRVLKRISKMDHNIKSKYAVKDDIRDIMFTPVNCLGHYEVRNKDNEMVKWPTKKSEEVFAYLLLNQNTYISKWTLLDLFWSDLDEERGLNNLYSTIFRIKQVLYTIEYNPNIKMLNAGYMLEAEEILSDFELLKRIDDKEHYRNDFSKEQKEHVYFSYKTPLFGIRDYFWSVSYQESIVECYRRLYLQLLSYYKSLHDVEKIECIIRYYAIQHIEDEKMLLRGLEILKTWQGEKKRFRELHIWLNSRLKEMDLPEL